MMEIEQLREDEHTRFEKARLIGSRALQLSMGAPFMIKLTPKQLEDIKFNPIEVAKLEFEQGLLPIAIKRNLPKQR